MEIEVLNCRTEVKGLTPSKRALDDSLIAIETRRKDVNVVRIVQSASYRSLKDEAKSLRRQCTIQMTKLASAWASSAKLQVYMDAFPLAVRVVMDTLVSELKNPWSQLRLRRYPMLITVSAN